MSPELPDHKPAAPKWSRMPAALRITLEREVQEHLKRYGSRHYELLRDDPRFRAWTGVHLGHRGEKYFDRVVGLAREDQARRSRAEAIHKAVCQATPKLPSMATREPLRSLGNAGAPSFGDMLEDLNPHRQQLKIELAACLDERGLIANFPHHSRCLTQLLKVERAIADLTKHYNGVWAPSDTRAAIFKRVFDQFRNDPDAGAELIADIDEIIRRKAGISGVVGVGR